METYHLRRIERDMPDRADQLAVLRAQKYLSLGMALDNEPYLVSLCATEIGRRAFVLVVGTLSGAERISHL